MEPGRKVDEAMTTGVTVEVPVEAMVETWVIVAVVGIAEEAGEAAVVGWEAAGCEDAGWDACDCWEAADLDRDEAGAADDCFVLAGAAEVSSFVLTFAVEVLVSLVALSLPLVDSFLVESGAADALVELVCECTVSSYSVVVAVKADCMLTTPAGETIVREQVSLM